MNDEQRWSQNKGRNGKAETGNIQKISNANEIRDVEIMMMTEVSCQATSDKT